VGTMAAIYSFSSHSLDSGFSESRGCGKISIYMKILFAEDERKVGKHVKDALTAEGYAVDWVDDGHEALWLAENYHFDLIVLDIMLPERDRISILRQLRRSGNTVPVLFLTARSDVQDRAFGLDAGADDYLVKPFSVVELLARVRALFRRQRPELTNRLKVEDLEMDLLARTVTRAGQSIALTNREFSLLELLMMASPKPVSKVSPGRSFSCRRQLLGTLQAVFPAALRFLLDFRLTLAEPFNLQFEIFLPL
jgi:two-component system, OmpR family, copper resistance phosphate regulon response regulator CusR